MAVLMNFRQLQEVIPVDPFAVAQRQLRTHVQRFSRNVTLVLSGTDLDAEAAAGTVFHGNLNGVELIGILAPLCRHALETSRSIFEISCRTELRANRRVRAHEYTFT